MCVCVWPRLTVKNVPRATTVTPPFRMTSSAHTGCPTPSHAPLDTTVPTELSLLWNIHVRKAHTTIALSSRMSRNAPAVPVANIAGRKDWQRPLGIATVVITAPWGLRSLRRPMGSVGTYVTRVLTVLWALMPPRCVRPVPLTQCQVTATLGLLCDIINGIYWVHFPINCSRCFSN